MYHSLNTFAWYMQVIPPWLRLLYNHAFKKYEIANWIEKLCKPWKLWRPSIWLLRSLYYSKINLKVQCHTIIDLPSHLFCSAHKAMGKNWKLKKKEVTVTKLSSSIQFLVSFSLFHFNGILFTLWSQFFKMCCYS